MLSQRKVNLLMIKRYFCKKKKKKKKKKKSCQSYKIRFLKFKLFYSISLISHSNIMFYVSEGKD